jgi:TonB family protein
VQAGVDPILDRRLHPAEAGVMAAALGSALVLHLAVAAAAVYGPELFRRPPPPLRVLPVKLVPLRALGVEQPNPRPAAAPRAKKPEPEPRKPEVAKPAVKPAAPEPPPRSRRSVPKPAAPPPEPAAPPGAGAAQREGSLRGSPLGISGRLGSEVGVDNPDFVYDYYLDRMLALIEAQWTRPPIERAIEARLHFQILQDGRLAELEIVQPSGSNSFDLAALRAVQNAAPFPPLPSSYRSDSLGVNLLVH